MSVLVEKFVMLSVTADSIGSAIESSDFDAGDVLLDGVSILLGDSLPGGASVSLELEVAQGAPTRAVIVAVEGFTLRTEKIVFDREPAFVPGLDKLADDLHG